jgi:hypothetical protein
MKWPVVEEYVLLLTSTEAKHQFFQFITCSPRINTTKSEVEDYYLVGCCAVQSGRNWPMSQVMDAVNTSETSISFYQITRRKILQNSHLQIRRRKNLKCHLKMRLSVRKHQTTKAHGEVETQLHVFFRYDSSLLLLS